MASNANVPHHRHPAHHQNASDQQDTSEASPLVASNTRKRNKQKSARHWLSRHFSLMQEDDGDDDHHTGATISKTERIRRLTIMGAIILFLSVFVMMFWISTRSNRGPIAHVRRHSDNDYILVDDADEHWLPLTDDRKGDPSRDSTNFTIWFRTWGKPDGIPVLFVHGGPGNAIADYHGNSNKRFFGPDSPHFFVVEVDQRGTGNSQPSVRQDWRNMKFYQGVSIDKICDDFEQVRKYLNIDEWLVWGGSFGSTLSINYGERYPASCLALILRAIYLDTAEEVYAVYSQKTYLKNPKRLHEFNILYQYAASHVQDTSNPLEPNDAERLMRIYADMINSGDKHAIWHWFVFENNLMELDPRNILDPNQIDKYYYQQSLSIAFFETRLWIHGSFEEPTSNLLDESKVQQLTMPMWICQGQRDEVCPPKYGRRFVNAIETHAQSPRVVSRLLNATHEDTDPTLEECLKMSLREYMETK